MKMTAALNGNWNDEQASARPIVQRIARTVVAAAILLPLAGLILISQQMSAPDASLILAGMTGVTPPSLCRSDLRHASLMMIDHEQIRATLNDHQPTAR